MGPAIVIGTYLIWAWGDENGLPAPAPQYVDFYNGQLPKLTITKWK